MVAPFEGGGCLLQQADKGEVGTAAGMAAQPVPEGFVGQAPAQEVEAPLVQPMERLLPLGDPGGRRRFQSAFEEPTRPGELPEPSDDALLDFSITDVNPDSARYGDAVSPRDYLGQVSAWYFGHST